MATGGGRRLLPFVQLDLAGALPLPDGRYLSRPEGQSDGQPEVLAVRTLGAPRARRRLRRGRPVPVEPEPDATPLPLARITVIGSAAFGDRDAAQAWLRSVRGDRDLADRLVTQTVRTVNQALDAHRAATLDPSVADVVPATAAAIRFGYGTGEEVIEGRWIEAEEMLERDRRGLRRRIYDSASAQERVAAVLGGREAIDACETLVVRARADHDAGRLAAATAELTATIEAIRRERATKVAQNARAAKALGEAEEIVQTATQVVRSGAEPDPERIDRAVRLCTFIVRRDA